MEKEYTLKVMECDVSKPASHFIYPKELVNKAVDKYVDEHADSFNPRFGQLFHDGRLSINYRIDTSIVSHIVISFFWIHATLYANIKPLDTPLGRELQEILETNPDSVSLHHVAYGDVDEIEDSDDVIVTSLTFTSFDVIIK